MNDFRSAISLISVEWIQDENGVERPQESKKTVLCAVKSVGQSEFYDAKTAGLKPAIVFVVHPIEYSDETVPEAEDTSYSYVEYRSKKYSISRTYKIDDERLELHCVSTIGGLMKTIDQWADDEGVKFLDYQGFDMSDPDLFEKQFSENEFKARMAKSNVRQVRPAMKRPQFEQDEFGVERPAGTKKL